MEVTSGVVQVTLSPNTLYNVRLIDQNTLEEYLTSGTSNGSGVLTIALPETYTKYDGWFSLEVMVGSNVVYLDSVTAIRPYVDTATILSYMENKISSNQAISYERIARLQIESIIGFQFQYARKKIRAVGNGTDYLPVHDRILKIHSVKENGETIWESVDTDEPFVVQSNDLYTVTRDYSPDSENKLEYRIVWTHRWSTPEFTIGADYEIDADCGWPVIPQNIQEATLLLINDIYCGNNRYARKYISRFENDNSRTYFDNKQFAGTGNVLVDQMLAPYTSLSIRAQVL